MKTKLFIAGVVALFMAMPAAAQDNAQDNSYQRWSINVNGGFSGYLPSNHSFLKDLGPSFGLGLDWTNNPLWGLSLDYQYFGFYNNEDYGHTNEITFSGQFNISNMLSKFRRGAWEKFNAYVHFGVGGAISLDPSRKNKLCGVMPAGLMFEYNITPLLALNLNLEGRWHTNTFRDVAFNPNGVLIFSGTVGLRIKLGTRNHIRNICRLCDYEAAFQTAVLNNDNDALLQLQKQLGDANYETIKNKSAIDDAARQIDALKREIDNMRKKEATPETTATAPAEFPATIGFDFSRSNLKSDFYPYLDEVALKLIQTRMDIAVIGHTDNVGDPVRNMKLSIARANAVANYLIKKGVDNSQLTIKGMSDTHPIADNNTEEGRTKNRRVEFVKQ